jgi:hypothetical protein
MRRLGSGVAARLSSTVCRSCGGVVTATARCGRCGQIGLLGHGARPNSGDKSRRKAWVTTLQGHLYPRIQPSAGCERPAVKPLGPLELRFLEDSGVLSLRTQGAGSCSGLALTQNRFNLPITTRLGYQMTC